MYVCMYVSIICIIYIYNIRIYNQQPRFCISALQVYAAEPILGIQFTVEDVAKPLSALTLNRK